jgi:hypothetical protein
MNDDVHRTGGNFGYFKYEGDYLGALGINRF